VTSPPVIRAARGWIGHLARLIAVVGPPFYLILTTVLGFVWTGYDPVRQTQSELGSVGAPHAVIMNLAGFSMLGVVLLLFAWVYRISIPGGVGAWLATVSLAVAGLGMLVVGFFPCDPGCVDVSPTGELHGTFSMPGAIGLPVAMMISAGVFRRDGRFGRGWQVASYLVGAVGLMTGPVIAAGLLNDVDGLLQRAAMWPPLLWTSAVALRVHRIPSGTH
jgi:hypothetical protein